MISALSAAEKDDVRGMLDCVQRALAPYWSQYSEYNTLETRVERLRWLLDQKGDPKYRGMYRVTPQVQRYVPGDPQVQRCVPGDPQVQRCVPGDPQVQRYVPGDPKYRGMYRVTPSTEVCTR